jgi:hypothetical protein
MPKTRNRRRLADTYTFAGFRPESNVQGIFGDPQARVVRLVRRGKKHFVERAARRTLAGTTAAADECGTFRAGSTAFTWIWRCGGLTAGSVVR